MCDIFGNQITDSTVLSYQWWPLSSIASPPPHLLKSIQWYQKTDTNSDLNWKSQISFDFFWLLIVVAFKRVKVCVLCHLTLSSSPSACQQPNTNCLLTFAASTEDKSSWSAFLWGNHICLGLYLPPTEDPPPTRQGVKCASPTQRHPHVTLLPRRYSPQRPNTDT